MPTGSKDPFALRRAALGSIRLISENNMYNFNQLPIDDNLLSFEPDIDKYEPKEASKSFKLKSFAKSFEEMDSDSDDDGFLNGKVCDTEKQFEILFCVCLQIMMLSISR